MELLDTIDRIVLWTSFIVGILVFKKASAFFRLLILNSTIGILYLIRSTFFWQMPPIMWVENCLNILSTGLLLLAAYKYFNTSKSKILLVVLFITYLLIFFLDIIYITEPQPWGQPHIANAFNCIVLSLTYLAILYTELMKDTKFLVKSSTILISLGIVYLHIISAPFDGIAIVSKNNGVEKYFLLMMTFLSLIHDLLICMSFIMLWYISRDAVLQKKIAHE